jgi:hypothetical protein
MSLFTSEIHHIFQEAPFLYSKLLPIFKQKTIFEIRCFLVY